MEFINDLVGHCKIHICKIAFIEKHPSQRNIINLRVLKITIKEIAPKTGENVTMALTNPYAVIKINSKKPIEIK